MRKILALLIAMATLLGAVCAAGESKTEPFRYVHDPRRNPGAMQDIVENPAAVYGFSPDPDSKRLSSYAEYDWTDPVFVAEARQTREEYHASMESMMEIVYRMRDEGAGLETIARAVSAERNRVRLASVGEDQEGLAKIRESNLNTYGHEDGPTPDQLFEKYGSWQTVLQKAFSPNLGMDAVCGLYDEFYNLYVELGLAEPEEETDTPADGPENPGAPEPAESMEKTAETCGADAAALSPVEVNKQQM